MQKNATETKLKLRKAEQEITTLQGAVSSAGNSMKHLSIIIT